MDQKEAEEGGEAAAPPPTADLDTPTSEGDMATAPPEDMDELGLGESGMKRKSVQ